MKVAIALDSFKGSLSSVEAGKAVSDGILKVYPEANPVICPMADGGEGTVEAICTANSGQMSEITVSDPLGRKIKASYAYLPQSKTAVIEMSAAAGITLLTEREKNPLNASTYGVGELICDALNKGCRRFIIGIGGSATNDGGVGMLSALGFGFLDAESNPIAPGAKGLAEIQTIRLDTANPALAECTFQVACDVTNPLCGESGCSAVYGPQKGATAEMIVEMDKNLKHYAQKTKEVLPHADETFPGAGAAGGMGYALVQYLNAVPCSGVELVMLETGLEQKIKEADFVVVGEGRLDGQSVMGKAPIGVAQLAKKYNLPVIAFAGCVTKDARLCNVHGIDAFFPILKAPCSLEDALKKETAYRNLKDTAEQAFRLIRTVKKG